jgi:hypothetical protein
MKQVKKQLKVSVSYAVGRQDPIAGSWRGGVDEPRYAKEIALDVRYEEDYDETQGEWVDSGTRHIHLRGTRRSYRALARYLLALCEFVGDKDVNDPHYRGYIEGIQDSEDATPVVLIVHGPRANPAKRPSTSHE